MKDDILQIQNCTYSIKKLIGEMDEIYLKINSMSPELLLQIKKCKKFKGKDYSLFTDEEKELLCAVVNNTKSLSFLITKSVGEEGE